jgi:hypothetical protein
MRPVRDSEQNLGIAMDVSDECANAKGPICFTKAYDSKNTEDIHSHDEKQKGPRLLTALGTATDQRNQSENHF